MLDLAIIGSGPAALSSALYVARAGLSVQIFERGKIGGALNEIAKIENFPGFMGEGQALARQLRSQALTAGTKLTYGNCKGIFYHQSNLATFLKTFPKTTSITWQSNHFRIYNPKTKKEIHISCPASTFALNIDNGIITTRAVLIATGSEPRPLPFKIQPPVAYCALCDAPLFKGKDIAVVGGGNSAVQESLHLANIVKSLTIFVRETLSAEPYLITKLRTLKNVTIYEHTPPTPDLLQPFAGVFVFIGHRPATTFLDKTLLDPTGYLKTVDYMTKIPGLFSAGDVRQGSIKQAITASADGVVASLKIIDFLKNHSL